MSPWRSAVADYIQLRRNLGFHLRDAERALSKFAAFLERHRAAHLTLALALQWAQEDPGAPPATGAWRLSFVRGFARHWRAQDPQTEVPPADLLPHRRPRPRPYLYSDEEVRRLLEAALRLPPVGGLRGLTYHCLLGLLAVTGLRVGEARHLLPTDVDLAAGLLTIRNTKFGKSRLVPIHPSTQRVLARYAARRDRMPAGRPAAAFFVSQRGTPLSVSASTTRFTPCRSKPASAGRGAAAALGCTTSGTASPSRRSSGGTGRGRMSSGGSRCCRPISATSTWRTPTGT